VCDLSQNRDLTIEQWGSFLMLHGYFRDSTSADTSASIWMGDLGGIERPAFVTVASGPEGTVLYLDGKPRTPLIHKSLVPESYTGSLLLGHSPSGGPAWTGNIFGLAFYDRALTPSEVEAHHQIWLNGKMEQLESARGLYTFDEGSGDVVHNRAATPAPDFFIPRRFEPFRLNLLQFPHPFKKSDVEDTIVNIVGFIPFGILLTLYLRDVKGFSKGKALLLSVILGAITSLFIELAQVLLPTRDSSALDLINNVVGTLAGSVLVIGMRHRLSRFLEGV
jgi:VanZ family protein